jgi:hypothetical protein
MFNMDNQNTINTNHLKGIPLNEIVSFLDKIADLYNQYQDIADVCHSLTPHFEQEDACQRKVKLLESMRYESEACLTSLKNNMFIEVRNLMRRYQKQEQ